MEKEVGKRVQTVAIIWVRSEDLTYITGEIWLITTYCTIEICWKRVGPKYTD